MKIYTCNKKRTEWFKRVDWIRVLIVFVIVFLLFFSFFHFIIGGTESSDRAVAVSLLISYLIAIGYMISYSIENRINVYIEKDDKIYVLFPHKLGNEYENTTISYKQFKKLVKTKENIEVVLKDIESFEGVDLVEILKVEKIKKYNKRFKFTATANIKQWEPKGGIFTIKEYVFNKKYGKIKFIVPTDYEDYEELYNLLENKIKK